MPAHLEKDDINEAAQTDELCLDLAKHVARKTANAFF